MSYAAFHLVFLLPPIVLLAVVVRWRTASCTPRSLLMLGLIQMMALAYTTPWDNYLVYRGVWTYGPERVLGTIGYVPVEEYVFFLLQPVLTGLWYLVLRDRLRPSPAAGAALFRLWGTAVWSLVAVSGVLLLLSPDERFLYLGLITAWCGPPLAGMSWLGYRHVWLDRKAAALGLLAPTVYLWIADRFAIADGIWDIADRYSTGIEAWGLPVEEALFFLVTNALVVQGLAMLLPEREAAHAPDAP